MKKRILFALLTLSLTSVSAFAQTDSLENKAKCILDTYMTVTHQLVKRQVGLENSAGDLRLSQTDRDNAAMDAIQINGKLNVLQSELTQAIISGNFLPLDAFLDSSCK